jgi:hypothetical protein
VRFHLCVGNHGPVGRAIGLEAEAESIFERYRQELPMRECMARALDLTLGRA